MRCAVRKAAFNPRDIQKNAAVWASASFANLSDNAARYMIPRK
jgi:hypothetical protein